MNVSVFVTLLTLCSTVTALLVEAFKKILDEKEIAYSSNVLACIVGCVVGIASTALYYGYAAIQFNALNIVCMVIMGIASSVGAMVGYDKVLQMVKQISVG